MVADESVDANARRPSGHCASACTQTAPLLVGVKVNVVPYAGSWPRASQTTRAPFKSIPAGWNVAVTGTPAATTAGTVMVPAWAT